MTNKGRVVEVLVRHRDLPITRVAVKRRKHLGVPEEVNSIVHTWQRTHVPHRHLIELAVMHGKPHCPVAFRYEDHRNGPLGLRGLDHPEVPLTLHLLGDDVPRGKARPIGLGTPWPCPGVPLDPMRGDIDLAKLSRPRSLVLHEKAVNATAKRIKDSVPVALWLGIRLVRRVRRGLFHVDSLVVLPACLDLLVGLASGAHQELMNLPNV